MINKKDLFIRIIDSAPDIKYRVEHAPDGMVVHEKPENEWKDSNVMQGCITINGRSSKFYMYLDKWNAADYVQQWDEGLQRLEKYDQTCLVANIVDDNLTAVEWWLLYKINGRIYMQYHIYCTSPYKEAIKNGLFTPETCYDFIPPRKTHEDDGEEISEWVVGAYWDDTDEILAKNKGIQIKIVDDEYTEDSMLCRIFIGNDFYDTFEISDCCWSVDDYITQWKYGLQRLRTNDASCLIISASNPDCGHFIEWWLLYKKNGMVYARNQIILGDIYEEMIGTRPFTPETCYDFIPAQFVDESDDAKKISSLCVNYNDFFI